MSDYNLEWRRRPDLAEIAEAIGIDTADILAVVEHTEHGVWYALFTPEPNPDADSALYRSTLRRDEDGIVRAADRVVVGLTVGQALGL